MASGFQDKLVPALLLDAAFAAQYAKLKKERALSWVVLRIADGAIRVVGTGDAAKALKDLQAALPERQCAFIVFDHRYKSDDGMLTQSKLFYVTFIPPLAPVDEKVAYETQKGKALSRAVPGAIEITVHDPDELKRKIYGVSGTRRKTTYQDDLEVVDDDWMDE